MSFDKKQPFEMKRRTRRSALALGLAILVAAPLASGVQLALPAPRAEAATVEKESPDFASEVYGDAWDYSNSGDVNTNAGRTRGMSVSGGKLHVKVVGGDYFSPVNTVPGALSYGRDGNKSPVSTSRYNHMSFEMTQPDNGVGAIYWFTCTSMLATCAGGQTFKLYPGTHVYDFDLTAKSTVGAKKAWKGSRVVGMRVVPSVTGSKTKVISTAFNWMRIYDDVTTHGAYPPGTYDYFSVKPRPQPVVDSPNTTQGKDITSAEGLQQWVFTGGRVAGVGVKNATVKSYSSKGMTATNSGSKRNDPEVLLASRAFPGSKYRYLSIAMKYDGGFSLSSNSGGGKMARWIWGVKGTSVSQESNDIVTYSGANAGTINVDLAKGSVLDENSKAPRQGWAGKTITSLRFDPNEDPGAATWHLLALHLRAAPAAKAKTTIQFHDAGWVAGTTATIKVGKNAPGGTGYKTVASKISVAKGVNSFAWKLGSLSAGAYHVQVTLNHPDGTAALAYSKAAITMSK